MDGGDGGHGGDAEIMMGDGRTGCGGWGGSRGVTTPHLSVPYLAVARTFERIEEASSR